MRFLLLAFCLLMSTEALIAQRVDSLSKSSDEINLRLDDAGQHLQKSSELAGASLVCAFLGTGASVFGLYLDSPEVMFIGGVVTVLTIPLTIGSIVQMGKSGSALRGEFKAPSSSEWKAVESGSAK